MDIDKIILNRGYNLDNNKKIKAFFPTIVDKDGIAREDEFDEEFAKWIKAFYPFMIKYFGSNETEKFLEEYTYELNIDPIANGSKESGTCYRTQKRITSNWAEANIHNAAIAFLHEAGHAVKIFFATDELLLTGFLENGSIFAKLDEANVSQGQYELESGKFSHKYMNLFDEELDFKTISDKYPCYQVYLECLKLLLGEHKDLLDQNAKAPSIEEKDIIYQQIKMNLKNNLSQEQIDRLVDCLNGLIIHVNYPQNPGDLKSKYQNLVVNMRRYTPEQFQAMYEGNVKLAKNRGTYDRSITEDIDELCSVVVEVLRDRLKSSSYDKFGVLKQISTYFCNIRNSSDKLKEQTDELFELWKNEISGININLLSIGSNLNNTVTEEDKMILLTYLFSIEGITQEDLSNTTIFNMPENISNNNDSENSVYINVGNKGIYKFYKEPPKTNKNVFFIMAESTEDPFMREIKFKEVEFVKEFPSGETRGELIDTLENRNELNQAVNNGTKLIKGEFFEQFKVIKQKSHEDD